MHWSVSIALLTVKKEHSYLNIIVMLFAENKLLMRSLTSARWFFDGQLFLQSQVQYAICFFVLKLSIDYTSGFQTCPGGTPALHIVCLPHLSHLIRLISPIYFRLHELHWVGLMRETYNMSWAENHWTTQIGIYAMGIHSHLEWSALWQIMWHWPWLNMVWHFIF